MVNWLKKVRFFVLVLSLFGFLISASLSGCQKTNSEDEENIEQTANPEEEEAEHPEDEAEHPESEDSEQPEGEGSEHPESEEEHPEGEDDDT